MCRVGVCPPPNPTAVPHQAPRPFGRMSVTFWEHPHGYAQVCLHALHHLEIANLQVGLQLALPLTFQHSSMVVSPEHYKLSNDFGA